MQPPLAARVLGPAARGQRRVLAGSTGLALGGVLLDLARPWPLAFAVDHALVSGAGNPTLVLGLAAGAALAATLLFSLVDMGATVLAERSAEQVGATLRHRTFAHALTLSPSWHDRTRGGELVSRLTTDVGRLLDALVAVTLTLLPDALRLALVLAVLTALAPSLALVALAVVPVLAALAVRQRRRVRAAEAASRQASGRLAALTTDVVRNVRAVQAFARHRRTTATYAAGSDEVRRRAGDAIAVEARWTPVADLVLGLGSALVLVAGGHQVVAGRLSTGELLVVLSYVASLYSPVRSLSRLSGVLAKAGVSAARIADVLDSRERVAEPLHPAPLPAAVGELRCHAVSFSYRAGAPVLRGFDLTVRAGETVAIVGASGAGKSTLLSLLLRLHDVDAGAIMVGGVDVRDLPVDELRRRIAYVPQDAWLFDTTIAENIGYGAPAPTRHEVVTAARTALVDEFATALADGYDSEVGEGGSRLSGGQRRRIALARAIVADAPVLLLDEPTSALDPAAAATLVRAIRRAAAGRTVVLVTHDPELAATADRVIAVERSGEPIRREERKEVTS